MNDAAGQPVLQARYVWGQGLAPLAMWRKTSAGVKLFFYSTDGQESVRQLTDSSGSVTDSYFYDAWGNGLAGGSGTTENPFRYTGQQRDPDGRYYLRARFYNPGNGRFLSHDPLMGSDSDPVSMHRYLYGSADAINRIDPSGRADMVELGATIGVIGTLAATQTPAIEQVLEHTEEVLPEIEAASGLIQGQGYAVVQAAQEQVENLSINSDNLIRVFRGTNLQAELDIQEETGHILSEAARRFFMESGDLGQAYEAAESTHSKWIEIWWSSEELFAQAHGEFGQELPRAFAMDRTLFSVTTDPEVASYFAGSSGVVFSALVPSSYLIPQTIEGAGEEEFLMRLGSYLFQQMENLP